MSEIDDVSDEILNAATDAVLDGEDRLLSLVTVVVARAILAERERCAKAAEDLRVAWSSAQYFSGFNDSCNAIAKAIRNPQEPT